MCDVVVAGADNGEEPCVYGCRDGMVDCGYVLDTDEEGDHDTEGSVLVALVGVEGTLVGVFDPLGLAVVIASG